LKDDITGEVVIHSVNFFFFFQKVKSYCGRPISIKSEVILVHDDFIF